MNVDNFSISEKDYNIVMKILTKTLKEGSSVYAFGSRITGKSRKYSDLDLLICTENTYDIDNLRQDFHESSLGFNVDVVDRHSISDEFFSSIKDNMTLILEFSTSL